ncbi:inositol 2-dehydrogenase [Listeria kieliensis]|nr:inositol 2-dehydrogenase [Listeria kieliensis]
MKSLNVGMIGAGRVAQVHLGNLKQMKDIKVKTICDIFAEDSWKERFSVENVTKEAADIFNDPEIDAVFICTPTDTHTDLTIQAANAGKHIFCEKPVGTEEASILDAYHAVLANNVKFQTGFNRRFDKSHEKVKLEAASQAIGERHILKITSRDPEPPNIDYVKRSGGIFMDMMIHDFDMARFMMDDEVEEVFTYGNSLVDPEIGAAGDVDTAIVSLKFKNGAMGVIDNSRKAVYGYDQRIEVFGEKGMLQSLNQPDYHVNRYTAQSVEAGTPKYFFLERYQDAFFNEEVAFFDSIRQDQPTKCSFKDGIMAIRIAEAAKKSLETGEKVAVNLEIK